MPNIEKIMREHLRRMAEPDDMRRLREQASRIRADRALQARRFLIEIEKDRLRREIREAGEQPVA